MLSAFPGALLCISHDREFLDNLCNRIVQLTPAGLREFRGNYSEYRAALASEAAGAQSSKASPARPAPARAEAARNEPQKPREEAPRAGAQVPKIRNAFKFEKLEQDIMRLEEELAGLQAALLDEATYRDGQRLRETQTRIAEVERDLQQKNHEWENWQ
jgi:ATPase subunit of ABC transporter with duplicated ATPase domains